VWTQQCECVPTQEENRYGWPLFIHNRIAHSR
jgi:hypothetical protein